MAQLIVNEVLLQDPDNPTFWDQGAVTSPYKYFTMTIEYHRDTGRRQVPTAGPILGSATLVGGGGATLTTGGSGPGVISAGGGAVLTTPGTTLTSSGGIGFPGGTPPLLGVGASCEVVQLCNPWGWKIVRYSAARVNAQPDLPAPEDDSPFQILQSAVQVPSTPTMMPDGNNFLYRVTGEYRYILSQPFTEEDDLPMGSGPYNTVPANDPSQILPAESFVDDLIPPIDGTSFASPTPAPEFVSKTL